MIYSVPALIMGVAVLGNLFSKEFNWSSSDFLIAGIEDREDADLRGWDQLYTIDSRLTSSGRWWNRNYDFPCPLAGHDHELSTCKDFYQMTPKDRQVDCQGKICKTCIKAGGKCLGSNGKCTSKVPMETLCKGCVAYCAKNRLSPHNLLFCTSNHPAHMKPSMENLQKIFDKYFGRPWGRPDSSEQVRSGTFTCTQTRPKKKRTGSATVVIS